MSDTPPTAPLDLSAIEGLDTASPPSAAPVTSPTTQPTTAVVVAKDSAVDTRLVPQPRPVRLVEVSKLSPEELAAAIDFRNTGSLLAHGDGVLAVIAQASRQMGRNVELENFTSAMYEAREIAVERMQAEASAAKAEGVVGVDIHEGSHGWQTHVIEFFAIGTAVLPLEQEIAPEKIADPIMVLSVND